MSVKLITISMFDARSQKNKPYQSDVDMTDTELARACQHTLAKKLI